MQLKTRSCENSQRFRWFPAPFSIRNRVALLRYCILHSFDYCFLALFILLILHGIIFIGILQLMQVLLRIDRSAGRSTRRIVLHYGKRNAFELESTWASRVAAALAHDLQRLSAACERVRLRPQNDLTNVL